MKGWPAILLGAILSLHAPASAQSEAANKAYEAGKFDQARQLWNEACDGNDLASCYELAIVYRDGEGVAPDRARYLALIGRACDGGVASACYNIAKEELSENEDEGAEVMPAQLAHAIPFYEKACKLGMEQACTNLSLHRGQMAQNGADPARIIAQLAEACSGGSGPSCFQLANLFDSHEATPVRDDPAAANAALKRGCARMDRQSCQNLAWHYAHGFGMDADWVKSTALYQLACDDDVGVNCPFVPRDDYGARLRESAGILERWQPAGGAYERACDADFAPGCFALAKLIARSGSSQAQGERIRALLGKALALEPDYPIARELLRRLDVGELPKQPAL